MSPRRNRPRGAAGRAEERLEAGPARGPERVESWQGEQWIVRQLAGSTGGKHYRCPGCDQEIPPGIGHLVAWPEYGGVEDRRHWHTACWNARDRRGARLQRSRNAPRY
ncbi:ATP/GTP-binding protein [Actinacidiphila sp. bgisy160]|uniref:ATP/GTP-binding protein n=1 Tax=Actinacidiphila sp. bgisy160 TaxID=3413796 RepID=UPI003D714378